MLAAFLFAVDAAENATPVTAPADFQAGIFNTMFGVDVRDEMQACFVQDP